MYRLPRRIMHIINIHLRKKQAHCSAIGYIGPGPSQLGYVYCAARSGSDRGRAAAQACSHTFPACFPFPGRCWRRSCAGVNL